MPGATVLGATALALLVGCSNGEPADEPNEPTGEVEQSVCTSGETSLRINLDVSSYPGGRITTGSSSVHVAIGQDGTPYAVTDKNANWLLAPPDDWATPSHVGWRIETVHPDAAGSARAIAFTTIVGMVDELHLLSLAADGSEWLSQAALPFQGAVFGSRSVAEKSDGSLLVAAVLDGAVNLVEYSSSFTQTPTMVASDNKPVVLALSANDDVHLLVRRSQQQEDELYWVQPPNAPERVGDSFGRGYLMVGPSDANHPAGRPHVFAQAGDGMLVHYARDGAGQWSAWPVAAAPEDEPDCTPDPACKQKSYSIAPLGWAPGASGPELLLYGVNVVNLTVYEDGSKSPLRGGKLCVAAGAMGDWHYSNAVGPGLGSLEDGMMRRDPATGALHIVVNGDIPYLAPQPGESKYVQLSIASE